MKESQIPAMGMNDFSGLQVVQKNPLQQPIKYNLSIIELLGVFNSIANVLASIFTLYMTDLHA
jgi:hypothetical protein